MKAEIEQGKTLPFPFLHPFIPLLI